MDEILDPALEVPADIGVVLVEIGKTCQATVFNLPLVVPVIDIAVLVVVILLVEGVDFRVVVLNGADVIGDDVNHNPNSHGVCSVNQLLQSVLITKV